MALLIFNIATAVLVAIGATAAIFGDTCVKRKLTLTGWIALVCIVAGFGVGVAREILAKNESELVDKEHRSKMDTILARSALWEKIAKSGLVTVEKDESPSVATKQEPKTVLIVPKNVIEWQVIAAPEGIEPIPRRLPLPDALVSIIDKEGNTIDSTRSDNRGNFRLVLGDRDVDSLILLISKNGKSNKLPLNESLLKQRLRIQFPYKT